MTSSTSSSPYPPVVPRHCSNVPVLFELLKSEEEQCRVWLRAEMKQIPDPLIDSLFCRFIMSSSLPSALSQSCSTVSELCELLEREKVETKKVLRGEMDRLVNTLFDRLTNKLRTNSDLDRSEDAGDRALVVDTLDRVESHNPQSQQPSSLIAQPSTSTFNPVAHQQHSNGDEMQLNTAEMIEIKKEVEDGEEIRVMDIAGLTQDNQGGEDDESRSLENAPMDWVKQEIKEEFEDGEMLDIKKEEEDGEESNEVIDNEVGGGESSGEDAITETTQQIDGYEIKGEFDYGHEIEINQEEDADDEDVDESTNNGEMMEIKKEEDEEDSETQINDIEGFDECGEDDGSLSGENGPMDWVKQEIKEEFEEIMDIKKEEDDEDCETQIYDIEDLAEDNQGSDGDASRSVENEPMDTTPAHPTGQSQANVEQSRRIVKRKQTDQEAQVHNEVNNEEGVEGDDEDDVGEGTSRPVKRSRPPIPTTSSSTEPNQFITHTLQCPQCLEMFAKEQFTAHLWDGHSILPFRCPVKDCNQSFNHNRTLGKHLDQSHQSTTEWHCGKCDHHYTKYNQLSMHNIHHHQLGHFQCSFPACTFTGEYKRKVINHYAQQHRPTLKCPQADCLYQTRNAADLKKHQRIHADFKPYRCKWAQCEHAATDRSNAIRHIQRKHLAHNPRPNGTQLADPADYLELVVQ